jgi:tetratricopeptide (TPR) repeat protein
MRTTAFAAAAAFAVTLAVLSLTGRDATGPRPAAPPPVIYGASTDAQIGALQARVRAAPTDPDGYTLLASRFLQKVRETGDAGFYARAERALRRALQLDPRNAGALTERGALRMGRHDFSGALRDAELAHRLAPEAVRPYGVIVDANVELGRLTTAARTLQRMIDLKPDLAAYARVSYLRELRGDLRGARSAMELAVASGAATPENAAYVNTLLGDLELGRGRRAAARRAYDAARRQFPGYVRAEAGLARVAAARGDLPRAIRTLRDVVTRLPLPEYSVALGEAELAAGRPAAARRDLALVRAQEQLLRGAGVNTDVEVALFEADHGSPARAVALARAAWRSAPSFRSADALGWALTRAGRPAAGLAWARRAMAPGGRDPNVLFHAGMSARAAGRPALARALLRRALARNPQFSPLRAPQARRALEGL